MFHVSKDCKYNVRGSASMLDRAATKSGFSSSYIYEIVYNYRLSSS